MRSARLAKAIPFVAVALAAYACAHGIDNGLTGGAGGSVPVGVTGIGGAGGADSTATGPGTGGAAGDTTVTGPTTAAGGGSTGGSSTTTSAGAGGNAGSTTSAGGNAGTMDASVAGSGGSTGGGGNTGSAGTAGTGGAGTAGTGGAGLDAAPDVREAGVVDAPPETGCMNAAQCALKAALIHRYTFSGTGTTVTDSVGTQNGTVVNATLGGNGSLTLTGGTSNQYVNFPNNLVRTMTNASFEFWVTWNGGAAWQRIFDFGNTTGAEDTQGTAATSFYLTPQGGDVNTTMFAALKRSDQTGTAETRAVAAAALAQGTMIQLTVVVDDTGNQLRLYRNGTADGTVTLNDSLSVLTDVNVWLGRSQYNDPEFGGIFHEFRIYNAALTQAQVQAAFAGGTDPMFLQ